MEVANEGFWIRVLVSRPVGRRRLSRGAGVAMNVDTPDTPDFDGSTYKRELDHGRLTTQLQKVRALLTADFYKRRTLQEIALAVGAPEASVSARIRDLRKQKFGGYYVKRERRTGAGGTWEYWVEYCDE